MSMIRNDIKKLNVLIITPFYYPNIVGGAEISSQLIAEGLVKKGHSVSVLTCSDDTRQEMVNGVMVYRKYDNVFSGFWKSAFQKTSNSISKTLANHFCRLFPCRKRVKQYVDFIKDCKFDFVILNSNEEYMARPSIWKALFKAKIPNTITFRDTMLLNYRISKFVLSTFYRRLIKKQLKWIQTYTAPSKYMFSCYEKLIGNDKKTEVIYNAVDFDEVNCNFSEKENVFLYAGSLRKEKGVITLLNAFKLFSKENNKYKLLFVGRGEMEQELSNNDGVDVIPWIKKEDLYSLIRKSKCVILPSEQPEAFGRTIVESIYNGTLALGSDYSAIPEIITNQAYLFERANHISLSKKLKMIAEFDEYKYLEEIRYFQKNFEKFSFDNYIERWNSFIENCVNKDK